MKIQLLALVSLFPAAALAHSKLDTPIPVNTSDANKNPTGPCGTIPAAVAVSGFTSQGDLIVNWFETVNHVGWYELRFAPNGPADCTGTSNGGTVEPTSAQTNNAANKVCPTLLTPAIMDPDDAGIVESDPKTWKKYTKTVKMPATTCTNCILQLIQWMGSGTGAAKTFTPYYSCARITTGTPQLPPDMAGTVADMAMSGGGGSGGGGGGGAGAGGGGGGGSGAGDVDMAMPMNEYHSPAFGCSVAGAAASSGGVALLLLAIGALAARRVRVGARGARRNGRRR